MRIKFKTKSANETKKIAKLLAEDILKGRLKTKKGLVLAFSGNLGSGKTTFIQGFLRGLGIKNKITSPTFVIMKRYKNAYHIDCYRFRKPAELVDLGFKKLVNKPENIFLIEWAERIKKILPKDTIWLEFKHGDKENEREITIR
ncbi:MAG: tRNA (adenosine(37)-N6)-threonylcarbamoyltransferase complex ATPase subunit type 1 TsaE [Candidatus Paceibacterota bacterium]|jgi:tRNA threonylcarbamoyladenosine biosynthesis protein TsaE